VGWDRRKEGSKDCFIGFFDNVLTVRERERFIDVQAFATDMLGFVGNMLYH
jgi:hypothetical protein